MNVDLQREVFCLLGLPFDKLDMPATIQRIREAVAQRTPCIIATPNLNFIIGCIEDSEFREAVARTDICIVDGKPPVWIMRLLRIPIHERVAGSDLFEVLRRDSSKCVSVYFFGGQDGAAEIACRKLNSESSGIKCVGFESPGFGSVEAMSSDESIAKINASGADFLVVALGAKKGHLWIERNRSRISVPVISHLGAVLNFVAGTVTRAPKWMQRCGLEWLGRIKEEPALWRRYFHDGRALIGLFATCIIPHVIYIRRKWPTADQMAAARLEVSEDDHCCVVRLWGAWTHINLQALRDILSAAVQAGKDVRLEMGDVTFIGSSFLGLLILLSGYQKQRGRQLKITSVPKQIRRVFNYCCAEYLFSNTDYRTPQRQVQILNGQFDPLTLPQTVEAVFELLKAGRRGWLCTVNVSILMMMRGDRCLQNFVDRAAITVADGQPLVWCASWFGQNLPQRVAGVDLIDALCARAAREGKRVYFLGASEATVLAVVRRLRERHANLHVDCADGYFSKDEAAAQADRIRANGTDILFVGTGVPRQENFIDEQWDRLGVGMAIGVGGSFDVLGGRLSRAPVWMQKIGLEWLFRAIQEPRRLFPRYLVTNTQLIWLVLGELSKRDQRLIRELVSRLIDFCKRR